MKHIHSTINRNLEIVHSTRNLRSQGLPFQTLLRETRNQLKAMCVALVAKGLGDRALSR